MHLAEDVDELLAAIRNRGLDVLEEEPPLAHSALQQRLVSEPDEIDISPVAVAQETANDAVRVYLREMGASPLLTREGEVEIAKRVERGHLHAFKALSRSPIAIQQVLAIGEDLKRGLRLDVVVFDEEEVTEEISRKRAHDVRLRIEQLQKHYKSTRRLAVVLTNRPARAYRRRRWQLGREMVQISLIIRNLGLTGPERKRLAERLNKTVECLSLLDGQQRALEKKIASTDSDALKKKYPAARRDQLADI